MWMYEGVGRYVTSYGVQFPLMLVLAAGCILSIAFWRRHPKVSLLALIGFGLNLLDLLLGTFIGLTLGDMLSKAGLDYRAVNYSLVGLAAVRNLTRAVGWAFIVAAVFSARNSKCESAT